MTPLRSLIGTSVVLLAACSGSRFESTGGASGGAPNGGAAGASGSGATSTGGSSASGGTSASGGGTTGGTGGAAGAAGGAAGAAGACPTTTVKGTQLVKIDTGTGFFCVDRTEVQAGQYANFLAAGSKPTSPTYCGFNSDYTPTHGWPASDAKLPVVGVDWCDAWAYCKWAGKRLCGRVGGGSSPPGAASATTDQWYFVCSRGGTQAYPYGNNYSATACNGGDGTAQSLLAVPSSPTCQGGFGGVFDMSGNVSEWVDDCEGYNGAEDNCQDRSGSFMTDQASQKCEAFFSDKRGDTFGDVGFRCCWDPA